MGYGPRHNDRARTAFPVMLSIGKLGAGQERYYTEKVAGGAEDYYSGRGEAEGRWTGRAAGELGLDGEVGPDRLTAMLTGRNPVTGAPLGLRSAPGRKPVPGFDLTFSAPKSVSLAWTLGGHPVSGQVMEAHPRRRRGRPLLYGAFGLRGVSFSAPREKEEKGLPSMPPFCP